MNSWSKKLGHPVLNVKKLNNNQIVVSQQPFISDQFSNETLDFRKHKY